MSLFTFPAPAANADGSTADAASSGQATVVRAPSLSKTDRELLAAWRAQLQKLLDQRRRSYRTRHLELERFMRSSTEETRQALLEVFAPGCTSLLEQVTDGIRPYFARRGDAIIAAREFPILTSFRDFLLGPEPIHTIDGATTQAKETVELVRLILRNPGAEFWTFHGAP